MSNDADETLGRYTKVFVGIWASESFLPLPERSKYLFLYLLTCCETSALPGVVRTNLANIGHALGWTAETVREHFDNLSNSGMAVYDPAGLVWLPRGLRFNAPINPNVVKAWSHTWKVLPACPLKAHVYDHLRAHCADRGPNWLAAFDGGCKRPTMSGRLPAVEPKKPAVGNHSGNHSANDSANHSANDMANQKQYQEQKQEQKEEKNSAQARMCACEDSSADGTTDPPDLPTVAEPPPSAKTAPSAIPADEDEATGPLTSRGASLPLFRATAPTTPPAPSPAPLPPAPVASPAPVVVVAPEPCPAPPPACVSPDPDPAEVTPAPSPSAAGSDPEVDDSPTVRGAVGEVFAHWSRVVWANAHVAPKLTKERRTRIKARLAEGYTVADLCLALDGVKHDPWLMGTADGARPGGYRDVMTVLRDGAQVERLMGLAKQHAPKPKAPPSDRETLRPLTPAQEAFLARGDALGPRPEFLALGRNLAAVFASGALGLGCGAPRPEALRG